MQKYLTDFHKIRWEGGTWATGHGRNRLILAVIRVSLRECVPPCSAWEDVLLGSCLAVTVCDIRGLDRGMRSTECHFSYKCFASV